MSQEHAWQEEKTRASFREALAPFLGIEDKNDPREVYQALLAFLRDSPARLVVINLEDLWLETQSQNVPSTSDESPNWRRKARYSLDEFRENPNVLEALRMLAKGFHSAHQDDERRTE
jgi:4-alpha-glucanotransferase